jgi:quercetin dioxygenase-like cupin family protein
MTNTNIQLQLQIFFSALREIYAAGTAAGIETGREIRHAYSLLESIPAQTKSLSISDHPVLRHADAAAAAGSESTAVLLNSIMPVIRYLPWKYSYAPRKDANDIESNIAFAEIIGPLAPFYSNSFCLGLTLIAPGTRYPEHRHPAIELYYVAAGTAQWTLDNVSVSKKPGDYILHESMAIHAMNTTDQPLLAAYTWTGHDIRTTSAYV